MDSQKIFLCPVDRSQLQANNGRSCPSCGGRLFLDGEFEDYLKTATPPTETNVDAELRAIVSDQPQPAGYKQAAGRVCPNCGKAMLRQNYDYDSNVFIDSCPKCQAMWVDKQQIPRMVAYLVANDKFQGIAEAYAEKSTKEFIYDSAKEAARSTRVYPYSPERSALLGLAGGNPAAQYKEYSTLASVVRWPKLYWLARVLIVLTWIAYVVMRSTRSTVWWLIALAVLAGCYLIMTVMHDWAKVEQAKIRQADLRGFEKPLADE